MTTPAAQADPYIQAKVQHINGGDKLVVASGGQITLDPSGTLLNNGLLETGSGGQILLDRGATLEVASGASLTLDTGAILSVPSAVALAGGLVPLPANPSAGDYTLRYTGGAFTWVYTP